MRAVQKDAFQRISPLGSVVLNDGLEVIGEAAFRGTGLRAVRFPATLREIGAEAFCFCSRLKSVEIPRDGGLERVGDLAFQRTAIRQIALPGTLRQMGKNVFRSCNSLKKVCVEDGCGAALASVWIPPSVIVGPLPDTVAGTEKVWDLRTRDVITIPDGVERIGDCWFYGCEARTVTIPASVKEIGRLAFCNCRQLDNIIFSEGSRL